MKIIVDPKELHRAFKLAMVVAIPFQLLDKSLKSKNYQFARLATSEGGAKVSVSNGEMCAEIDMRCQVVEKGECLIRPDKMAELGEAFDKEVTLSTGLDKKGAGEWLVECGGSELADKIPLGDLVFHSLRERESGWVMKGSDLASGIELVSFAVGRKLLDNSTHTGITGLQLSCEGEVFTAEGTNGKRMAVHRGVGTGHGKCLIPRESAEKLKSFLSDSEVQVQVGKNVVEFAGEGWKATVRQLEGLFPPCAKMVGISLPHSLQAKAGALAQACRQASIMSPSGLRQLQVTIEDGSLSFSAKGERGKARSAVKVEGEAAQFLVSAKDFSEPLERFGADEPVELHYGKGKSCLSFGPKLQVLAMNVLNQ